MTGKDHQWLYESGRMVEHFRVMRPLGRGGMGEIYLARDTKLGRKVALKVVQPAALGSREAIDRFLFEARATARFSHPHIVTIHAVGEDSGKPYVALEYLEGQTLRQRLEDEQPGVGEILRIGLAIAEALQEAHRQELLHRDLKPDNVMLCQDGRPRVLDFGLAKSVVSENESLSDTLTSALSKQQGSDIQGTFQTQVQGIKGTPAYMAPEQWMERTATGATDVWALGVILYELVCGRRPYEGTDYVQQALQVCSPRQVPPVERGRDVPGGLSELIGECLEKDPAGRPSTEAVVERLRSMLRPESEQLSADQSPFLGLLPFDEQHSHLFFGRESEVAAFLERVRREPVLPVVGPSGAGKSSFVQAGVTPRLRERAELIVLQCRPGRQPFSTLASRIVAAQQAGSEGNHHSPFGLETGPGMSDDPAGRSDPADGVAAGVEKVNSVTSPEQEAAGSHEAAERLSHQLRASPALLNLVLSRLADRRKRSVLLYVDQLEELYTLVDDVEVRSRFMEALCTASDDAELPVRVVFTLREEFLSRLAEGPGVREAMGRITVLRSPGPGALKEILLRPVEAAGYSYEDPLLVEEMVGEVLGEVGSLPLLQFAGQQLWERRDRQNRQLCRAAYEEMGGVAGALAYHADAVLSGLTHAELGLARSMLLRLVTPEETRRSEPRSALLEGLGQGAGAVLDRLSSSRLIAVKRSEEGEGEEELELVHESLIDRWTRLRRWIDESREDLVFLAEVGQAAELWSRRGLRQSEVWQGEALRDALRAAGRCSEEVPARVVRFLVAGQRLERRRRWRRRGLLALAAVLLVGIAGASVLFSFTLSKKERAAQKLREDAEQQRDRAVVAADQGILLQARLALKTDPSLALAWLRNLSPRANIKEIRSTFSEAQRRGVAWVLKGHHREIPDVQFSPDGALLASAGSDKTVRIWEVSTRKEACPPLRGHKSTVWSVAFSPDGRVLASAGHDGKVNFWDVHGCRVKSPPLQQDGPVYSVAFSRDAKVLVTANHSGVLRLWNIATGKITAPPLRGHTKLVNALAFSPDGRLLASASFDRTVRLWNVRQAQPNGLPLKGHESSIYSVAFSPDGELLATAGKDETVRLWNVASGKLEPPPIGHHEDSVWSVTFSPDGRLLASASWDGTIRLWDVRARTAIEPPIRGHSNWVVSVAFSPDGEMLASSSTDSTIRLWQGLKLRRFIERPLRGHADSVEAVAFSPSGRLLASASTDKTVRLWNATSREPEGQPLSGHEHIVRSVAFSPDEKLLASASFDGTVRLWNTATHKPVGSPLRGHGGHRVGWVAFSPDGRSLASVGSETVRFWDVATGRSNGGHLTLDKDSASFFIIFSPDGKLMATSSGEKAIRLWHTATRKPLAPLLQAHTQHVRAAAFSPDSKVLASASYDRTIRLWDVAARKAIEPPLKGHQNSVVAVAFSPDGKVLASASYDRTIRLWDVAARRPIEPPLRGHGHRTLSVAFSPDGKLLASSEAGKATVMLWDISGIVDQYFNDATASMPEIRRRINELTNLHVSILGKVEVR